MTRRQLLNWATQELRDPLASDAPRDAEYLLTHILQTSREYTLAHDDTHVPPDAIALYKTQVDRRKGGEPLAHIIGETWFFSLPFTITPHVLIPRPETEGLVERVAQSLDDAPYVIDVGTGCGAIIIALAHTTPPPPTSYFAIDISPHAIDVARKNAKRNHVAQHITFVEGSLLDPLPQHVRDDAKRHTYVIGNLPYLPNRIIETHPDLRYEPRIALFGGDDGLDVIRGLCAAMETVAPPWTLFLEIDPVIIKNLHELLSYHFPNATPQYFQDLHGYERICVIRRNG